MSESRPVEVPDLGDFTDVDVVEVLVRPGDRVEAEDSLITLETDKASMEVPAPEGGVVQEVKVTVGSQVSAGDVIAILEVADPTGGAGAEEPRRAEGTRQGKGPTQSSGESAFDIVVLGSGPGGYTAAFRAADLGQRVALVERFPTLGGVCLNVGCIPSKALLHAAKVIDDAAALAEHGVVFAAPRVEPDPLRGWKQGVVDRLTGGLQQLAKRRRVEVVQGVGAFSSPHELQVRGVTRERSLSFERAIIATGSRSVVLDGIPHDHPRVMDSTSALELEEVPPRLLVVGGGIIGLEMATVYAALGSRVTVVELLDRLMSGCDADLVRPLAKRLAERYDAIYLGTRVTGVVADEKGLEAAFEGGGAPERERFDRLLVAVGRQPNGDGIGAEAAGVEVDERGFINTDSQQRTNVEHIFAIGDVTGGPMLAHRASHQGKVAAEAAAGLKSAFDARVIPSVAYTDPEVAWVGLTEEEARAQKIDYGKGVFPWAASGRSLALGRDEGSTKLLFDPESGRLLGAGIVGPGAGELIAEAALAIEMGSDAADLALTVHPHPTLSETLAFAAEAFEGTITDLYMPRRR